MSGYIGSKASVVSSGAERKKTYSITGTTTVLTGASYTPNQVHVFHNGVRLVDGTDYTATDGSTVTLTTAAENGDEVVVISYATFQTSDTVSASAGGTFSNAVTIDANGATVLTVDRATSDGTIIDVQKNGTTVGSIASRAGVVTSVILNPSTMGITEADTGGGPSLSPTNGSGAINDAAVDLGTSSIRWQDLYLSGGVYLGGTGAANYLDDYEEGTFTPTVLGSSTAGSPTYVTQDGYYTKIGRVVNIGVNIQISNKGGMGGNLRVAGLPFSASSTSQDREITVIRLVQSGYGGVAWGIFPTNSSTTCIIRSCDTAADASLSVGSIDDAWVLHFGLTYRTDA